MKITLENIDREKFQAAMDELGILLQGRGKEVAEEADMPFNTYKYYLYHDRGESPETKLKFWTIYKAALRVVHGKRKKILTALSHLVAAETNIS